MIKRLVPIEGMPGGYTIADLEPDAGVEEEVAELSVQFDREIHMKKWFCDLCGEELLSDRPYMEMEWKVIGAHGSYKRVKDLCETCMDKVVSLDRVLDLPGDWKS